MAEKDFTEKHLENFDDVFADLMNVLLFGGARRVAEKDLESGMPRSGFKVDGHFAEQERDAKKYWKNGEVRIAMVGFENQTREESDFVFRNIGYDGAEYRDQLRRRAEVRRENAKRKKEAKAGEAVELRQVPDFYPVLTIVLYFGERKWTGSLHLKEHLGIPEGIAPFVSDYTVNLFDIAHLSDEQVEMFQSDFRYVAQFFVTSRKRKEGQPISFSINPEHVKHVEEFIELMNAVTNSDKFSSMPRFIEDNEIRGGKSMWTILFDEAEARGEARGMAKGQVRGADMFASLLRKIEPGSCDYYRAINATQSEREELYRHYGVTDTDIASEPVVIG